MNSITDTKQQKVPNKEGWEKKQEKNTICSLYVKK